jgi:hypothetical protein
VQVLSAPDGEPLWVSPVVTDRHHDTAAEVSGVEQTLHHMSWRGQGQTVDDGTGGPPGRCCHKLRTPEAFAIPVSDMPPVS